MVPVRSPSLRPLLVSLRRLWKRWLWVGLAIAVLGWVVGCRASSTVTLAIALPGIDATRWQPMIAEFERLHPKIHIAVTEAHESTDELGAIYADALSQPQPPFDLVYTDIIWVPKFAEAGWLLPLDNRLPSQERAQFLPGDLAGSLYRDRLYRIPLRSDVGVLHYRRDLLQGANQPLPETYGDLLRLAQTLQRQNQVNWGYLWQGRPYEGLSAVFIEVLAGYGGVWIDAETLETGLNSPAALEAIAFLRQTIAQGISPERVTSYSEEETYRLFQDGDVAFLRNWPETWATINSLDSPVSGAIALAPVPHGPGQLSHGCQGGWGLAIAAATAHPQEAWTALEFFTSEEIQRRFALEVGYLPSRTALYSDPILLQHYPQYPTMQTLLQQSVLRPPIPQYLEASAILQRYLHAALTDRLSPEQAMQAATTETQALLARPASEP